MQGLLNYKKVVCQQFPFFHWFLDIEIEDKRTSLKNKNKIKIKWKPGNIWNILSCKKSKNMFDKVIQPKFEIGGGVEIALTTI